MLGTQERWLYDGFQTALGDEGVGDARIFLDRRAISAPLGSTTWTQFPGRISIDDRQAIRSRLRTW